MEFSKNDHKIILACDKYGLITEIHLDTALLLKNIKLPIGLHSIISPLSIKELGDFWINIQENAMEEGTMLTLNYDDDQITYIFNGYVVNNTVLICGSTEMTTTEKALEEIMLINNEQTNQIRFTQKRVDSLIKDIDVKAIDESFLNDFSNINNELINRKRELVKKNHKIELLNKELNAVNENMTMFTYSVSHDLKEPVRMVKSFLTLLHQKYEASLDQKGQRYLAFALDGANRLSQMLLGLLEYHRSSNLSFNDTVDLNEVLSEVKKIIQKEIESKQAQIIIDPLPFVKGSFVALQQIFQNLLTNAIKFVPEGKTPVISIHSEENENNYILAVEDNGIGISEHQKDDAFKIFKRLNPSQLYEGTGIGLAMVKKSIENMGGQIWLKSTPGIGSAFYFSIPKFK